jgi:hypothetical protein
MSPTSGARCSAASSSPRGSGRDEEDGSLQKGVDLGYGLGIFRWPTACGPVSGNGGDIAGYSNRFQNSENGKRQAGVIVPMYPMPEALGEPVGALKQRDAVIPLASVSMDVRQGGRWRATMHIDDEAIEWEGVISRSTSLSDWCSRSPWSLATRRMRS